MPQPISNVLLCTKLRPSRACKRSFDTARQWIAGGAVGRSHSSVYFTGAGAASVKPATVLIRPSGASVAKSVPPR